MSVLRGIHRSTALALLISLLPLCAVVIEHAYAHDTWHSGFSLVVALGVAVTLSTILLLRSYRKLLDSESARAENNQLTRTIIDSLPHAIAVLDKDGVIVSVNQSWHEFAALNTADEATRIGQGLNYLDSCRRAGEDSIACQARAGLEDLLAGHRDSFALEYPCHSSRQQRWFAMRANPLRSAAGGLVISHIDITDRKIAEQEMQLDRAQQATLRHMLEIVLQGGSLDDTLGKCLDLLLATQWLDIQHSGGIHLLAKDGKHLELTISRNLPAGVLKKCHILPLGCCLCGKAAANRKILFASHVDEHHDVSYPGMQDHSHYCIPLLDSQRGVIGVIVLYLQAGSAHNDTQERFLTTVANILANYILRQRSEIALQNSEAALKTHQQQLEALVAQRTADLERAQSIARLGSWELDIANDLLTWSGETYRIFGVKSDQPVSLGFFISRVHPDDRERVSAAWNAAMSGTLYDIEHRILAGTQVKWVRERAEVSFKAGKAIFAHGAVQDITEIKIAEEVTTQALAEARYLSKVKGNFLANMSHEIRTPLGAVMGLARIGIRENRGRKAHDTCKRILDAGQHLLQVVNDILDYSKIEAGRLSIESRPVQLNAIIDSVTGMLSERAVQKGIQLTSSMAPSIPDWVMGDPLRIQQILVNLVSNAIKFTERGNVVLAVGYDGDAIAIAISDQGIGMTEEQIAKLFKPFEQADTSTTRKYGGTGLGLAISMHLARLMQGDIQVKSALGIGTTFTLRLPLWETSAPTDNSISVCTSTGALKRLVGYHLLAAEDIEVNRLVLADLLEEEGATCTFAENGRLAVELVAQNPTGFDAVLMDIQMPEMDGIEATRKIRHIAPDLPVIGLSAHALSEERDRSIAAGMVEHVTKPIDPEELVSTILQHTRNKIPSRASVDTQKDALPEPLASLSAIPPAPTFPVASLIDWALLDQRFKGKQDFIRKLAQTVLDTHANAPHELLQIVARKNFTDLKFVAHSLKGLCGNLAAPAVQALAAQTDQAARTEDQQAFVLALELAEITSRFLDELKAHLEP